MSKYYLNRLTKESLKEIFDFDCGQLSVDDILNRELLKALNLVFCIIYNYDGVVTEHISNVKLDRDNIMEAIFFNDKYEIRVFNDEGVIRGTIFKELEDSKIVKNTYLLYPRYKERKNKKKYASVLKVKKYISYDEDNQAYIDYVKPSQLIFTGGEN